MAPDRTLVPLAGPAPTELKAALRGAGLPADDLDPEITRLFRLDDAAGTLGWAALEAHGREALLRSVLILDCRRGGGAGSDLVAQVADSARDAGIRRLWLLTETAASFFAGLGFVATERAAAPGPIRATSEFHSICPASATCMVLDLGA